MLSEWNGRYDNSPCLGIWGWDIKGKTQMGIVCTAEWENMISYLSTSMSLDRVLCINTEEKGDSISISKPVHCE